MIGVSRKVGERVRIGDQVLITVLAIHGHRVHLKISAPKSIPIWREESYQQNGRTTATEETIEVCAWLGETVLGEEGKGS
jgi:carbon storage regulator